jgi:hypothetical protein
VQFPWPIEAIWATRIVARSNEAKSSRAALAVAAISRERRLSSSRYERAEAGSLRINHTV